MKVLVVDEEVPYPLDSGKRIRVNALLVRMAKRHELTFCCYANRRDDSVAIERFETAGIRVVPVPPVRRKQRGACFYGKLAANLISELPYVSWNYCSLRMRRQLRELLHRERFDLVHSEMTLMSPLLLRVRGVPTIAVAHNVETDIWRRYEENERSVVRRMYVALQRQRVERLESVGLGHLTALCAVTERDAARFKR